jgi:hypothetical protein
MIRRISRKQSRDGNCTTKDAKNTKFRGLVAKFFVAFMRFVVEEHFLRASGSAAAIPAKQNG